MAMSWFIAELFVIEALNYWYIQISKGIVSTRAFKIKLGLNTKIQHGGKYAISKYKYKYQVL